MSGFRAFVVGSMFLAIVFETREIERLRSELDKVQAKTQTADFKLQEAKRLVEEGKKTEALAEYKRLAEQQADKKAAAEARRKAAALERELSAARAVVRAKREHEENKAALEELLEPTGGLTPKKPGPRKLLQAPGCAALEAESSKFAGKRLAITDKVERIDKYYNFAKCPIRISTDRLTPEAESELASYFKGKGAASVTMVGEYSGLEFYAEQIR